MSVGIIVMLLIIFNIRLTQAVKLTARRCLGHCVVKTLSTELTGGCRLLAPAYRQRVRVVTDSGLHLGFFSDPVPPVPWCLSRPVCPPLAQAAAAQERADDIG